ncbi:MAG: acyltransferase [Glaciihabitans sp.]|nr:acyltransferase [Glaciihabitans sp.]
MTNSTQQAAADIQHATIGDAPVKRVARQDIQGLRALAVLAVVAHHLLGWPSGGFIGVDIFFVVSGFLITDLILRERETTGSFSLPRFYAKRIRRIAPNAIAVILAVVAGGYFLFNAARQQATIWDAVYSFFFAANWRFADIGTDYFHATDATSPLQHFWSLGVEEQFYLLWPILLIIIFAVAASVLGTTRSARLVAGVVMTVLVVASFYYAVQASAANPTVAYFSSFTRAWEIGVGAVLATAAPLFARLPTAARFVAGWLGLVTLLASMALVDDTLAFPGPWAALPVAATAVVIAAGIGGPQRYLFPLVNPVSSFIGNISYSLYLWHFPIIVFALLIVPFPDLGASIFIVGMIVAVSITFYFLVEQPFHRSPLFVSFRGRAEDRQRAWQDWRDRFGAHFMISTVGIAAIVVAVTFVVAPVVSSSGGRNIPLAGTESGEDPGLAIQAELASALASTAWPTDLSPSLDDSISLGSRNNPAADCYNIGDTPSFDRCTWGSDSAPNHAYLVGDSIAMAYAPAFKAIAEASDGQWKITTIGLYGCRFTSADIVNEGAGVMEACPQRKADVAAHIASDTPQLVVVANAFTLGHSSDGTDYGVSGLVSSMFEETAKYNAAGHLLYLAPPPVGADLGQCYSQISNPQGCTVSVSDEWDRFAEATAAAAATGDHFISALPFTCVDGECPAFAGTVPAKYDSVHITPAFALLIAPALRQAMVAAGLM